MIAFEFYIIVFISRFEIIKNKFPKINRFLEICFLRKMPTPRGTGVAVEFQGKIYVIGGALALSELTSTKFCRYILAAKSLMRLKILNSNIEIRNKFETRNSNVQNNSPFCERC